MASLLDNRIIYVLLKFSSESLFQGDAFEETEVRQWIRIYKYALKSVGDEQY